MKFYLKHACPILTLIAATSGLDRMAAQTTQLDLNTQSRGNAATATALASAPPNCPAGQAPTGIDASGAARNCAVISGAGGATIPSVTTLIAGNGSGSGADSGISSASVVTLTGSQTVTNKTLDGITPTIMGYLGAISSDIQLQVNGKQAALGFTPLNPANNLAEIGSAGTARINLGLAPVASSGSASDLTAGTLPHSRLPVLLPSDIPANAAGTSGNAGTATALAANGTNCSAGFYPLGVDASGNAESCTAVPSGGGGASIPAVTSLISGNGAGNGSDSGIAPSDVVQLNATQILTNKSIAASQLTGTVAAAQMPSFTGDATSSTGSTALRVTRVNGITISGTPATGYVPTATSPTTATWQAAAGGTGPTYTAGNCISIPSTTISLDTACAPSLDALHSGAPLLVTTTSNSSSAYTGTMLGGAGSKVLNAYTKDQLFIWDVGSTPFAGGATTLNIDALGAKSVFEADGLTNPVAADGRVNQGLLVRYDGSAFRIIGGGAVQASVSPAVSTANGGVFEPTPLVENALVVPFTPLGADTVACWDAIWTISQRPAQILAGQYGTATGLHGAYAIYDNTGNLLTQTGTFLGSAINNANIALSLNTPVTLIASTNYSVCQTQDSTSFLVIAGNHGYSMSILNGGPIPKYFSAANPSSGCSAGTCVFPTTLGARTALSGTSGIPSLGVTQ